MKDEGTVDSRCSITQHDCIYQFPNRHNTFDTAAHTLVHQHDSPCRYIGLVGPTTKEDFTATMATFVRVRNNSRSSKESHPRQGLQFAPANLIVLQFRSSRFGIRNDKARNSFQQFIISLHDSHCFEKVCRYGYC